MVQQIRRSLQSRFGASPSALVYNSTHNKVYCANSYTGSVIVIDGAPDEVVATILVGGSPCALCYNPAENRVYVVNYNSSSVSVIRDVVPGIKEDRYPLSANRQPLRIYPNPAKGRGTIRYQASREGSVSLKVFNTNGQLVKTLMSGRIKPGFYTAVRDGTDDKGKRVSVGVYVYSLETEERRLSEKVVLTK